MNTRRSTSLDVLVLDRHAAFTMREVCRACGADQRFVLELVAEGIIDPLDETDEWQFSGEALVRARRAHRLMRDLGVNLPGVALALDLLDELEQRRRSIG